jgi:general secretion pathway protein G
MFAWRIAKKKNGFTLIEVMVVIAIIGILTSILVANFNDARKNSRDKIRKSDLKTIQLGLELYKSQNNAYPTTAQGLALLTPTYVAQVPKDPGGNSYTFTSDGSSYKVQTDQVESQYITSFGDEFARCPSQQDPNCSSLTAVRSTYAVYSAGAEGW